MSIFDPTTFLGFHTDLSVIAIITGIIVLIGMLRAQLLGLWTALFLLTAVLTSVTGFGFASPKLLPSHYVGMISLVVLLFAILGRYVFHLGGAWRSVYTVTALIALYFLVFVAIAQSFAKIPSLHPLAPTQSEPPFAIAQLVNLVIFLVLGFFAVRRFHPALRRH